MMRRQGGSSFSLASLPPAPLRPQSVAHALSRASRRTQRMSRIRWICLIAGDDNASLLTIIKSLYPDEWTNLCERIEGLEKAKTKERLRLAFKHREQKAKSMDDDRTADDLMHEMLHDDEPASGMASKESTQQDTIVQDWCSDRSRLLSRKCVA